MFLWFFQSIQMNSAMRQVAFSQTNRSKINQWVIQIHNIGMHLGSFHHSTAVLSGLTISVTVYVCVSVGLCVLEVNLECSVMKLLYIKEILKKIVKQISF